MAARKRSELVVERQIGGALASENRGLSEADRFFLEQGVKGLEVRASKGPIIADEPLLRLADRLRSFKRVLATIDRRVDSRLLAVVVHVTGFGKIELRERKRVEAAVPAIRARLEKKYPDIFPLSIDVGWETEHGAATIRITPRSGSNARPLTIDWNLVESAEYEELYSVEQDVRSIGPAPYFVREVKRDGKETEVPDSEALWDYIDARGHKGVDPPKETLAQKVERARGVARELSEATDSLNIALIGAEKMLASIGLGVYAAVDVTDPEEAAEGRSSEVAFAKENGEWRLVLVTGDPLRWTRTPILKCSKETRFLAAEVLPGLVDALIVAGEAQLNKAAQRVNEVNELVERMRGAGESK